MTFSSYVIKDRISNTCYLLAGYYDEIAVVRATSGEWLVLDKNGEKLSEYSSLDEAFEDYLIVKKLK